MFRLFPAIIRVLVIRLSPQPTTTQSKVKQSNISDILFIILTHGKLKQKNTYVNNCILENTHIVLPLMMAKE